MLIDWFTLCAQALNFLILVWLMRRFLYRPILAAIDAREKKIAKELADAAAQKADAQKEYDEFRQKNEQFDKERAGLLSHATDEAKAEGQRLVEEARKESDASRAKAREALIGEQRSMGEEITRRTREEVFAIARKALEELSSTSLEERIADVFIRKLRAMDAPGKDVLKAALQPSAQAPAQEAIVRSAFELPAPQITAITDAINETLSIAARLTFQTAPGILSGIELTAGGQKFAWSIEDYLKGLNQHAATALEAPPKP
jgi:F-type H+-transporting ATPase subunit b